VNLDRALEAVLELQSSDPTAPTTVRDPAEARERHVADSLVALELPAVRDARRIADIGSGGGWPGLALAAALPEAHVALVESASRNCRYLARAVAASGLANVEVVHARAEDWPEGVGAHDLVTARALASLAVVCEYAAPLLALGGTLVAWKGAIGDEEAADGAAAAEALGLEPVEVRPVQPFPSARGRTLHVLRKAAPTPPRFPRRPGMAVKRPIRRTPR
jgi:16S rRNA (guanine527-N7)-methyltransferase